MNRARAHSHHHNIVAFTMIELLFVIIIIALLARVSIPKFNAILRGNLRNGANKISSYMQAAYQEAVMKQKRVRVRFDFQENTFWAESYQAGPSIGLINENTKLDDVLMQLNKKAQEPQLTSEEKMQKNQSRYQKIDEGFLKPMKLPTGIKFTGLFLFNEGKKIEKEQTYIDFFPNGFSNQAIVYIVNEYNNVYSIILPSLGGRCRVEKGEASAIDA